METTATDRAVVFNRVRHDIGHGKLRTEVVLRVTSSPAIDSCGHHR